MPSSPKGTPDKITLFQALMESVDPDLLNAIYDSEAGRWVVAQPSGSTNIIPDPDVPGAYLIGE